MKFKNPFAKKINAVIVADVGVASLTLLQVAIREEIKLLALKTVALEGAKVEEAIPSALKDFCHQNHIYHKNVILKPRLDSLFIKRLQLPSIPGRELMEAIKWQIKEEVPFDLSGAIIDFCVIKEIVKDDGAKMLDVTCVAAKEEEVKPQAMTIKRAGFQCLAVIPQVFGYTELAARYLAPSEGSSLGILHLEEKNCYFSLHKNNKLEFYREIPITLDKLREALSGTLVSDRGKIELSAEEVNDILFNHGIPTQETSLYKDKMAAGQILGMLRPALERLAVEIKRSLAYYESQFQGSAVNKILLAGCAAAIPNLDKFLAQESSLFIAKIALEGKDIASDKIDPREFLKNYAGFGLAIDYEHDINLLPREFHAEKFEKLQKVSLRWFAFIAFLLLLFSYLFSSIGINAYQKRLDNAKFYLKMLSEIKKTHTNIEEFRKIVSEHKKLQPQFGLILKKISHIAPRELFIEDFFLFWEAKTGHISGLIKSKDRNPQALLTNFIEGLETSGYFGDVTIAATENAQTAPLNITKFKANFKLR